MEEKIIDKLLARLVRMCGLGEIIADVESVSGGFMHRMYKVVTDRGGDAVKHLNAESMDEAERKLGISEVRNTIDRIQYIHKMMPRIREALNTYFGV